MNEMKYPEFASADARNKSFGTWVEQNSINDMIQAGLFYSGHSDLVYCFHCGIGLYQWEQNDDPKTEHFKYSKHCEYIRDLIPVEKLSIYVCGNMPDEVSDIPPRVKRPKEEKLEKVYVRYFFI